MCPSYAFLGSSTYRCGHSETAMRGTSRNYRLPPNVWSAVKSWTPNTITFPRAPSCLNSRLLGYVTTVYLEPSSQYLGNWSPRDWHLVNFGDVFRGCRTSNSIKVPQQQPAPQVWCRFPDPPGMTIRLGLLQKAFGICYLHLKRSLTQPRSSATGNSFEEKDGQFCGPFFRLNAVRESLQPYCILPTPVAWVK